MGRSRNALGLLRKPLDTKGLKSFAIIRSFRACCLSDLFRECDQIFSHAIILLLDCLYAFPYPLTIANAARTELERNRTLYEVVRFVFDMALGALRT